jgi:predicted nucleic acid-binding protein
VIYFLDTSALAKRYLDERGSSRIRRLLTGTSDVFYQTFIAPLEFTSALYRRFRAGQLTADEAAQLLRAYTAHSHEDYLLVPYSDSLMTGAARLLARHPLRTLDAVQLAAALEVRDRLPLDKLPICFVASDDRLLDVARQEHLQVINPESR